MSLLLQRASTLLKNSHDLIPEQLMVSEVLVTKGKSYKQMSIMGRGRTGFGYRRYAHIWLRLEQINFQQKIESAESPTAKAKWAKMEKLINSLRETPPEYDLQPPVRERPLWKNRDAYDKPKPPRSR